VTSDQGTQIDLLALGQEPEEERTPSRRGHAWWAVAVDVADERRQYVWVGAEDLPQSRRRQVDRSSPLSEKLGLRGNRS